MSAAVAKAPVHEGGVQRFSPRYPVTVPVDVTVLRCGIPEGIPGRSLDVSETGLAAMLAGELRPGNSVGVELRLPGVVAPLRAKAIVRHQAQLRCGLEFVGLSLEQQTLVRRWAERMTEVRPRAAVAETSAVEKKILSIAEPHGPRRSTWFRQASWVALVAFVGIGGVGWWQWYRTWQQLETGLPGKTVSAERAPVVVAPGLMAQLLTHRVEPAYPDAARQAHVQGVVILDAVIGRDGSVLDLRPLSGPQMLTPAAMDAVKWWRFLPYLVNGEPAEVETTVAVEFREN